MNRLAAGVAVSALLIFTSHLSSAFTAGDLPQYQDGTGGTIEDSGIASSDVPSKSSTNTFSGGNTFSGAFAATGVPGLTAPSNAWHGSQFFGNGQPWADVRAGTNGCDAAAGDNSTDDHNAFQCQIDYLFSTYGGGWLWAGPGTYYISSTLNTPTGVGIWCAGTGATSLSSKGTDTTLISITAGTAGGRGYLENCGVVTSLSSGATNSAVVVNPNLIVVFEHNNIWGGMYGLNTAGVDGVYYDNYIFGGASAGGNVLSSGANWWIRDKFDNPSAPSVAAFKQIASGGSNVMENHFDQCDFSGDFTYSLFLDDVHSVAVLTGSVFDHPIGLNNYQFLSIVGGELATNFVGSVANVTIIGSVGFSAITATGASCAANKNITC